MDETIVEGLVFHADAVTRITADLVELRQGFRYLPTGTDAMQDCIARAMVRAQGPAVVTSALVGAVLVLGADLAARNLPLPASISIGHVTGILGGIYLLGLLILRGRARS